MNRRFTISYQSVFTILLCVLWSYKALIRYIQSFVMHLPFIGALAYEAFPYILFTVLIVFSLPYMAKKIRTRDLLFYMVVSLIAMFTLLFGGTNTEKFNDYALRFLTVVSPMYFIGIVGGNKIIDDQKLLPLLEKLSVISIFLNVFYYARIGLHFDAEWMSLQYLPYMILPHVSLVTIALFKEFKVYRALALFAGLTFMIFLGNRGSIVCYLILFLVVLLHKIRDASSQTKIIVTVVILGIVGILMYTNLFDAFTLFLLKKAESLGLSTRVVLFLRRDFEVVSLDSNRLELQKQLFDAIGRRPLGYGLTGDFSIIGGYSHNIIIEWLVEFGIVGGAIIIIAFAKVFIDALRWSNNWDESSAIWLFFCNVFIMLLISGTYLIIPEFFFLIGLCVSVKRINMNKGNKNGTFSIDNNL